MRRSGASGPFAGSRGGPETGRREQKSGGDAGRRGVDRGRIGLAREAGPSARNGDRFQAHGLQASVDASAGGSHQAGMLLQRGSQPGQEFGRQQRNSLVLEQLQDPVLDVLGVAPDRFAIGVQEAGALALDCLEQREAGGLAGMVARRHFAPPVAGVASLPPPTPWPPLESVSSSCALSMIMRSATTLVSTRYSPRAIASRTSLTLFARISSPARVSPPASVRDVSDRSIRSLASMGDTGRDEDAPGRPAPAGPRPS